MTYLIKYVFQNRFEHLNLTVFNKFTGINELNTWARHISSKCNVFDGRNCHSDRWWNFNKCRRESKKYHLCKKDYIWNPVICSCENGKYLASIIDDSVLTCDEFKESYNEETKTVWINFKENKQPA